MRVHRFATAMTVFVAVSFETTSICFADSPGDFDATQYVDGDDLAIFVGDLAGPSTPPLSGGLADLDGDGDVDAADFALFQTLRGHTPIPLRDVRGDRIAADSAAPYNGRQTCGTAGCHDVDHIANGMIHQQGRTDAAGNIIMQDDFHGDGQWWVRSSGMYGRWSGGGGGLNRQFSGKTNANESVMDSSAFYWTSHCGGCHAGGGGAEFDRDGQRFYDEVTGLFGYEVLGLGPDDVLLDGDYAYIDADNNGALQPSPWDATGVAAPECLHCHRGNRTYVGLQDMHREWRGGVLATEDRLVDSQGQPVRAFAAAGTAGQGWFSALDLESDPPVLQIDYTPGVTEGSLLLDADNTLLLDNDFLVRPPRDQVCWGCHLPGGFQGKRGTVWFDERDVMYAGFNNLRDDDPTNDIPPEKSTACNRCHPGNIDHNFAKGDSPYARFRDEMDWEGFRSCRECHLTHIGGVANALKDPEAPDVAGGTDTTAVHFAGDEINGPMAKMSCQACHVPYPLSRANLVTDRTVTGTAITYLTDAFLSADPLDPTHTDKTKWFPTLVWKTDSDGVSRLFPQKRELAMYWADWDQAGTPGDLSDDTMQPIILWRMRQITGNQPLPGVTDDNGDGLPEVNTPAEMLLYMTALKGNDSYGRQVAANPVLIKGALAWFEDPGSPNGVNSFEYAPTGLFAEGFETFGLDHNVLAASDAWGAGEDGCMDCHRSDGQSPVFDRKILIDPWDANGDPVYATVAEMTGVDTATYHGAITLLDALGNPITAGSTVPYSPRQTCGTGTCHDVDEIANGFLFQQGRTDAAGNVDMADDYWGDGRFWVKSGGRYGTWGQSFVYQLAAKNNAHESMIEQTTFAWVRDCSGCHAGGGPGEYDRDGELLYNEATGQFGWELSGQTPDLHGDYALMDYATGNVSQAPWNVTGLSEPDCLFCHRTERTITRAGPRGWPVEDGFRSPRGDMNWAWRKGTLGAGSALEDLAGNPVPAFAAATVAGQGWFSAMDLTTSPPTLQIDYQVGITDGSLYTDDIDTVYLTPTSITKPPTDRVCLSCHPIATITGTVWFDDRDVMYRRFNNLHDTDPTNDIAPEDSTTCNHCHRGGLHHNFAKGNSLQVQWRNEQDYDGLKTCRSCHIATLPDGSPNPGLDPTAPVYPGTNAAHTACETHDAMGRLSCQFCHIPYALAPAVIFRDITIPGAVGRTSQYYSADPLDPTNPDKSVWYPSFAQKFDEDGVKRLFPANVWINIYWGDWDENGTPNFPYDDVIAPILSWRITQAIGTEPLPIVTDDNGDGELEINRPEEILAYITLLKGNDSYGRQIAAKPVLVKGNRFWYEDASEPSGVNSYMHVDSGIEVSAYPYRWGMDHNVLAADKAWGNTVNGQRYGSCDHCHNPDSPVIDRLILVDPYDVNGQPVYQTVRELLNLAPPP